MRRTRVLVYATLTHHIKEFFVRLFVMLLLAMSFSAQAQLFPSTSDDISVAEAQKLFADFKNENAKMDEHSECFERAHMWALRAEKVHGIKMEKVYLYFTYKFQMKHRVTTRWGRAFTWWFHVAPAVRVNGELWVMDATFTDEAMPLQEWAGSLMRESEECIAIKDPMDFVNDRNISQGYRQVDQVKNQCYYTNAPRFFYQPLEIGYREAGGTLATYTAPQMIPSEWNTATWNWALQSYERKYRKKARQEMGF